MLPTLTGERLTLRPVTEDDLPVLLAMLREPSVAEWWGEPDRDGDREELLAGLAILVGGGVAGWLGAWEETDPMYPSVGLDITLTTSYQDHWDPLGRGLYTVSYVLHNTGNLRLNVKQDVVRVAVRRHVKAVRVEVRRMLETIDEPHPDPIARIDHPRRTGEAAVVDHTGRQAPATNTSRLSATNVSASNPRRL